MVSSISSKLPPVNIGRAPKIKGGKGKKTSTSDDDDDDVNSGGFAAVLSKVSGPDDGDATATSAETATAAPSAADRLAARNLVKRG